MFWFLFGNGNKVIAIYLIVWSTYKHMYYFFTDFVFKISMHMTSIDIKSCHHWYDMTLTLADVSVWLLLKKFAPSFINRIWANCVQLWEFNKFTTSRCRNGEIFYKILGHLFNWYITYCHSWSRIWDYNQYWTHPLTAETH